MPYLSRGAMNLLAWKRNSNEEGIWEWFRESESCCYCIIFFMKHVHHVVCAPFLCLNAGTWAFTIYWTLKQPIVAQNIVCSGVFPAQVMSSPPWFHLLLNPSSSLHRPPQNRWWQQLAERKVVDGPTPMYSLSIRFLFVAVQYNNNDFYCYWWSDE